MSSPPPRVQRAYLALAVGILCIGLSAIWVKLAAVPGPVSGFYRVLTAALVLAPWWLSTRSDSPAHHLPAGRTLGLAVLGGVFFGLDLALWNTALLITSAAQATLLANNAPLWVGLGAMLFFRERLPGLYWLGLALGLAGMALVARPAGASGLSLDTGSLLAIASSVMYAGYLLTTQRVRRSTNTLTFMTVSVVSSTLLLLALNVLLGQPLTGYPLQSWLALLGLGLVSQLGGWLAINYALGVLPATRVSVTLLGQVVVTTLLAVPLFGEIPTAMQFVGALMIMGGIYTVLRARESSS